MKAGDRAPMFRLPDQNGNVKDSKDYSGKWLVLYFYPKDNTSGCTREALDFSLLKERFEEEDCEVLGVSPDSPASHTNFIRKHDLTINLLSDESREVLALYEAWVLKKNYGREYMGVSRSTFLIDPAFRVAEVWRNVKVRRKTGSCEILHAQKVLDRLRELRSEAGRAVAEKQ